MKVVVVGSGPSGLHFAQTVLERGHEVELVDVGMPKPPIAAPDLDFTALKGGLDDPVGYFVGADLSQAVIPAPDGAGDDEYYGIPPSKAYVFETPPQFDFAARGFAPLFSFAAGGLAETWTGGAYPLNDHELRDFPFDYADIAAAYGEVAGRVGVAGEEDDLGVCFPAHDGLATPTRLDRSGAALMAQYGRRRERLIARHRIRLGRSRQAVLTQARDGREGCRYCGRCLWGCPNGAFYTPSLTLERCRADRRFTYRSGAYVSHFDLGRDSEIASAVAYPASGGGAERVKGDAYVLACGTLGTANIILRSMFKATREILALDGLMDNRQILAPFFNLAMLGRPAELDAYQYHQLALGVEMDEPANYVHGQITTLSSATAHPIVSGLPMDLKTSAAVFRTLRSGLCVANINFPDTRRPDNHVTLDPALERDGFPLLSIRYAPPPGEARRIRQTLRRVGRFLRAIGAPLIPGMAHQRPMGASVHYSGTLPMVADKQDWAVSPTCRSYNLSNLFVVDGSTMPFLPAKNLTFTLMANAVRIARAEF